MNKNDLLNKIIEYYSGGNKAKFAKMLGVKPQTINTWLSRETFDLELIYSKCEYISARWLLTGEGDMLIKEADDAVKSDENMQMWKERALLAEDTVKNLKSVIKTLQMVVEAEALKKMKKYSEEEQEDANGAESVENIAG